MKNNIIIINAFPNNEEKLMLLVEQLNYLKKLNKPILLISGCSVPEFIENKVDYLFVNSENEVIGKDYCVFLKKHEIGDFVFDYFDVENFRADFYWPNVNCTITKNIYLGFNLAHNLGYKTAFYTEDDNIWKDGSFPYINQNINAITNEGYKLGGIIGTQHGTMEPIIFTTFFFADIDFFCKNFTLPINAAEWYDISNVRKFQLSKTYEMVFYHLFSDKLHLFYNNQEQFMEMLEHQPNNAKNLAWGINDRRHSEKNLVNSFFTILPSNTGKKILMLNNQTFYLKTGSKTYTININLDNKPHTNVVIRPSEFYMLELAENVKKVQLDILNYGFVELDADNNSVINNGFMLFKDAPVTTNITNYLIGGRMGDFFQVLYVAQQQYFQTGVKTNIYITDNPIFGGDNFTEPLHRTFLELKEIILEQEYVNSFEIFTMQVTDFVNLNNWRFPKNLKPENFPWTNLFNKTYLNYFDNLKYEPWIKYSKVNEMFRNKVVIHRAIYRTTENTINWEYLISKNDCIFVGFSENQYKNFPFKHLLPFYKVTNLADFCAILNTCKFYVGNQTGPSSIAHAMDVPRLFELSDLDSIHYVGEEKFYPKLNWESNVHKENFLNTINEYIDYKPL